MGACITNDMNPDQGGSKVCVCVCGGGGGPDLWVQTVCKIYQQTTKVTASK